MEGDESMNEEMSLVDIVSAWKSEAGLPSYQNTVAVHEDGEKLFVVTKHPGLLIGLHGKLGNKYSAILREHGYAHKIVYVDMFCGDVKQF